MGMMTSGYNWDFSVISENSHFLFSGLVVTVEIAFISCLLGSLLSIPLTFGLRSRNKVIRAASFVVTECGRGVPLLVFLIWIHYVMPSFLSVTFSAFWSAVIALSVNLAAFLADVLRGGIAAIPIGHIEAAEALGLSHRQVIRRVLVPETIRRTIPTICAFYVSTLKLSTLAAVIGAQELLFASRIVNAQSPHPFELYTFLAVMFLLMVIPLSALSRLLETHPWFALYPKTK